MPAGPDDHTTRALLALAERALSTWPALAAHRDRLLERAARSASGGWLDAEALDRICASDLLLALAASTGDAFAGRAFDDGFLDVVPRYVLHLRADGAFGDEVRQLVRTRLLVAEPGREPRLAEYAGRGPLAAFVKICATRVALDLLRSARDGAQALPDVSLAGADVGADPELDYIRARYREPFEQAFRAALAARTSEERTLLRLSYFDRVTLHDLAALHRVHFSTMSRRLAGIRDAIREDTRLGLSQRVGARADDLSTLVRLLDSDLDVSISAFFSDSTLAKKK
jgi:RNA polymerase sigma-70 factor (ECF subfamily)